MKYYRHTITVEVLSNSDSDFAYDCLSDIDYHVTDGDCSGKVVSEKVDELTADEMAEALKRQGSDPSFLVLEEE